MSSGQSLSATAMPLTFPALVKSRVGKCQGCTAAIVRSDTIAVTDGTDDDARSREIEPNMPHSTTRAR